MPRPSKPKTAPKSASKPKPAPEEPAGRTSLRALGRATLARQMLLARESVTPRDAIARLVGLQAQLARPPFLGLLARVSGFRRESLTALFERREIVRATFLRGTIHVTTAEDFVAFRATLQPMLTAAMTGILKDRTSALDLDAVLAFAQASFAAEPATFATMRTKLLARFPGADERAMGYAVRTHVPLVQVPEEGAPWAFASQAPFADAATWLAGSAQPLEGGARDARKELVRRYLAAFGPATGKDASTWCGLAGLAEIVASMRDELVVLQDARGRELFDLPDAPRPGEDAPSPPRLLPEFDNLVLSHVDRTRFVADAHRKRVYLPGLRVAPTFLLDGLVAGTWSAERKKADARLVLEPFATVARPLRGALEEEADRTLRFLEPDARTFRIELRSTQAADRPAT